MAEAMQTAPPLLVEPVVPTATPAQVETGSVFPSDRLDAAHDQQAQMRAALRAKNTVDLDQKTLPHATPGAAVQQQQPTVSAPLSTPAQQTPAAVAPAANGGMDASYSERLRDLKTRYWDDLVIVYKEFERMVKQKSANQQQERINTYFTALRRIIALLQQDPSKPTNRSKGDLDMVEHVIQEQVLPILHRLKEKARLSGKGANGVCEAKPVELETPVVSTVPVEEQPWAVDTTHQEPGSSRELADQIGERVTQLATKVSALEAVVQSHLQEHNNLPTTVRDDRERVTTLAASLDQQHRGSPAFSSAADSDTDRTEMRAITTRMSNLEERIVNLATIEDLRREREGMGRDLGQLRSDVAEVQQMLTALPTRRGGARDETVADATSCREPNASISVTTERVTSVLDNRLTTAVDANRGLAEETHSRQAVSRTNVDQINAAHTTRSATVASLSTSLGDLGGRVDILTTRVASQSENTQRLTLDIAGLRDEVRTLSANLHKAVQTNARGLKHQQNLSQDYTESIRQQKHQDDATRGKANTAHAHSDHQPHQAPMTAVLVRPEADRGAQLTALVEAAVHRLVNTRLAEANTRLGKAYTLLSQAMKQQRVQLTSTQQIIQMYDAAQRRVRELEQQLAQQRQLNEHQQMSTNRP